MDFDATAATIGKQVAAVWGAPIPFAVAVLIAAFLIWKAMRWRYDGIIERLRADVAYLEKAVSRPLPAPLPALAKPVVESPPRAGPVKIPIAPPPVDSEGRRFLPESITPQFIAKLYRDLTGIQAGQITDRYVGNWMRVAGRVMNTSRLSDEVVLQIHQETGDPNDFLMTSISIMFHHNCEAVELLSKGDAVTCQGKVESITSIGITLTHGELVS